MVELDKALNQLWHTQNARAASYGGPIYVFDNASIHNRDRAITGGIPAERLAYKIPARSPDFNKVAEHVHHWLAQSLVDDMAADPELKGAEALKKRVAELFRQIPADAIRRDALSLKETFRQVVIAKGHYPPHRFM